MKDMNTVKKTAKTLRKEGKTYTQIAALMNSQGLKTQNGSNIKISNVSNWLNWKPVKAKPKVIAKKRQAVKQSKDARLLLEAIFQSKLTQDQKLTLIKDYVV